MAKKSKKSSRKSGSDDSSNMNSDNIVDERFIAAATRPQFQKAKRGGTNKKIDDTSNRNNSSINDNISASLASSGLGASLTQAIASDDRFAAALNSEKFGSVPSRDKYGRKTKKKKKSKKDRDDDTIHENDDNSDSDADSSIEDTTSTKSKKKKKSAHHVKNKDDDSDVEEEQDNSMEARIAYLNALSRGDISTSSSSSSESEDESDDNSDSDDDDSSTSSTNIHGKSGILNPTHKSKYDPNSEDEEVELTHEPSNHLCILNLNWEHVRAMDVYAMLHSFCPAGTLKNVQVFPSDFGMERMAKERIEGPGFAGLWKKDKKKKNVEDGDESEDSSADDNESVDNSDSEESKNSDGRIGEEQHSDESDVASDDEEDVFNLAEATSKLYSHFPDQSTVMKNSQLQTQDEEEEGFDIEALREYEASKLRYYFAIATFTTSQAAEVVYENVDGMEMENSAAEIDVRVLPSDQYESTIEGRTIRDSCNQLPAKYVPPENVVATALQQSRVTCSWERGDADRERKLTKYGMGKDAWEALAEGDDIKFYLATSDNSSESEESDSDDEKQVNVNDKKKKDRKKKGSSMRAMLGLAGSDDDDSDASEDDDNDNEEERRKLMKEQSISEDSSSGSDDDSKSELESEEEVNTDTAKSVTYTPGKHNLEQKIRSKLQSKQSLADGELQANTDDEPLTPFQKYLEKKKEKRRERRQAARGARKGKNLGNKDSSDDEMNDQNGIEDDGMYEVDPEFGIAKFSDEENDETAVTSSVGGDGFFLNETNSNNNNKKDNKLNKKQKKTLDSKTVDENKLASTKEELELLIAGDDGEYIQYTDLVHAFLSNISHLTRSSLPLYILR